MKRKILFLLLIMIFTIPFYVKARTMEEAQELIDSFEDEFVLSAVDPTHEYDYEPYELLSLQARRLDLNSLNIILNGQDITYDFDNYTMTVHVFYETSQGTQGLSKSINLVYTSMDGEIFDRAKELANSINNDFRLNRIDSIKSLYNYGLLQSDEYTSEDVLNRFPELKEILKSQNEFEYEVVLGEGGGGPWSQSRNAYIGIYKDNVLCLYKTTVLTIDEVVFVEHEYGEGDIFQKANDRLKKLFPEANNITVSNNETDTSSLADELGWIEEDYNINAYDAVYTKVTIDGTSFNITIVETDIETVQNEYPEPSEMDEILKMIAPDGKNAVFKMTKPTKENGAWMGANLYAQTLVKSDDYVANVSCPDEPYTTCRVDIFKKDYSESKNYMINVTYEEPEKNEILDGYLNEFNNFNDTSFTEMTLDDFFLVHDLPLINYLVTISNDVDEWIMWPRGEAFGYTKFSDIVNHTNVSYAFDGRMGGGSPLFQFEGGFLGLFDNGYLYGTREAIIYFRNIIYIPSSTADTKEAYIEAAQKKINDYLGNDSVVISYGGLISSLNEEGEEAEDTYHPVNSDGNYYNIKIGKQIYNFYIVKTSEEIEVPTYNSKDVETNIEITSSDSSIPLDTVVTIEEVTDESIKDKVKTDNYIAFNISLYSEIKGETISKLTNGKFTVKIPVPAKLEGKELIVYFISDNGEITEYEVTIEDGFAIFETDHFSEYVLSEIVSEQVSEESQEETQTPDKKDEPKTDEGETEEPKEEDSSKSSNETKPLPDDKKEESKQDNSENNPKTNDNIMIYMFTLGLSLVGLIGSRITYKKYNN